MLCGDANVAGRAAVAIAASALSARGIDLEELFARTGAKDPHDQWLLLHT